MAKDFLTAVQERRTYYALSPEATVSDERIQEVIEHAVKFTPSAFNSQTARVVLLLGKNHTKLWEITKDTLRKIVPAANFATTENKIDSCFLSGYGSILFFEEQNIVKGMQEKFPTYADNFPIWSLQSSGMLQFVIWTALEMEGFGASLQHYNPLIDEAVQSEWNIPAAWKLIAQMPFGKPLALPGDKEFMPMEERFKVFK
ncbi:MAG: nitroreductase family protein [Peptococcaceae bacterium]|nr:nitroreductase family protein [Peptococcaceae bacterium]